MLNKLSFNLAKELNESEAKTFKIKKRVFMESTGVRKERLNEFHIKNENRQTIWSSEVDTSEEAYNDYIKANFDGYDEDEIPSYDEWLNSDFYDDSELIWDDFKENIEPMIENQMNFGRLYLMGGYNSNYSDFKPSGNGGVTFSNISEFEEYISRWDIVEISVENGNLVLDAADHDGSIEVGLFTLIDDEKKIIEALGYYEESKKWAEENDPEFDWESDAETEFQNDLQYGGIDTQDLQDHLDLIIPIKNTL